MKQQLMLFGILVLVFVVAACTSTPVEEVTQAEVSAVVEPTIADIEADLDTSSLDELEEDLDLLILE